MTQKHYNKEYFSWQSSIGEFGGWANLTKFNNYIKPNDSVLDFGCGGGYLLDNIVCAKKAGIEINNEAAQVAKEKGIDVYTNVKDVPNDSFDVIISNHALEHVMNPLQELTDLFLKLKNGGKVVIVIPCETIKNDYRPDDKNHHLFSWGPMTLGNLLSEAGFQVMESKPYIHKWPPKYKSIARLGGRLLFEMACYLYGRIERTSYQVRAVGIKSSDS